MGRVVVDVMLKPEILDPQGKAVARRAAAARLRRRHRRPPGQAVRARGRRARSTEERARRASARLAETLLSNPVIEDFVSVRSRTRRARAVKIGVVTFPGSLDDRRRRAARSALAGAEAGRALARRRTTCSGVDAVVLPGGFSYGDYLRCGAIARFAPVMDRDRRRRPSGGLPVLGICNGFQILCESHLLPGALIRNDHRKFVCRDQRLRVENAAHRLDLGLRRRARRSRSSLKNGEGGFVADERDPRRARGRGPGRRPLPRRQPERLAAATSPASPTSAATSSA